MSRELLWRVPWVAARNLVMNEGFELSGYVAYTTLIALFPFVIFLASLAGFLGDAETVDQFIAFAFRFMPDDVAKTLTPAIREVLQVRQGGLLTVGIVATLWAASSGVEALRTALNRAYAVTEPRPIWYLRLQSIAFVIVAGFVTLLVTLTVIAGPFVWLFVARLLWLPDGVRISGIAAQYAFGFVLLCLGISALYRWLPYVQQSWRHVVPGAVVAAVLWLLLAGAFSVYLGAVPDYSITYGSLGGVIITLLFFYATALIVIYGAEINAALLGRAPVEAPRLPPRRAELDLAIGGAVLVATSLRRPRPGRMLDLIGGGALVARSLLAAGQTRKT